MGDLYRLEERALVCPFLEVWGGSYGCGLWGRRDGWSYELWML